jgi:hypothetical protein
MQVLSVSRVGDCINVEIGYEEDVSLTVPSEVGRIVQQVIYAIYTNHLKRRVVKASICLSEEEYERLRPAVGDEASIETEDGRITIEFRR